MRLNGLGQASLWLDEILTLEISSYPWSTLWISAFDPTPPIYYSIIKSTVLPNYYEYCLRLPSAIAGILTLLVLYLMMQDLLGKRAAIFSTLYLSVSIAHIEYSQEARAYALSILFSTLLIWSILRIILTPIHNKLNDYLIKRGVFYIITALLTLYTHNIGVFLIFAANISIGCWSLRTKQFKQLYLWFLINSFVFLLWLPWLMASLEVSSQFSWLKHITFLEMIQTIGGLNSFPMFYRFQPFVDIFFISIIFFGIYKSYKNTNLFYTLCIFIISTTILVWLTGLVKPIFLERTVLISIIFSAIAVGVSSQHFNNFFYSLGALVLVLIGFKGWLNYDEMRISENENWKGAMSFINNMEAEHSVILCKSFMYSSAAYYLEFNKGEGKYLYSLNSDNKHYTKHYPDFKSDLELRAGKHIPLEYEVPGTSIQGSEYIILIDSHCRPGQTAIIKEQLSTNGYQNVELVKDYKKVSLFIFKKMP